MGGAWPGQAETVFVQKKKREGSGVFLGSLEGGGLSPSGIQQLVQAVSWDPRQHW